MSNAYVKNKKMFEILGVPSVVGQNLEEQGIMADGENDRPGLSYSLNLVMKWWGHLPVGKLN
jgi:hypothetical protein